MTNHEKIKFPSAVKISLTDDFLVHIENVMSRSLAVDGINSYADNALDDLITAIEDIVNKYNGKSSTDQGIDKETEQMALNHFGMDSSYIDDILDHIAAKAVEIDKLDDIAAFQTEYVDYVISPSDPYEQNEVTTQASTYVEKKVEPRLKTLLFLLANKYGIDLRDNAQLIIKAGIVDASMMRQESYRAIYLPTLNRTILICDEVGNATYVADTEIMEQLGLDLERLMHTTKSERYIIAAENPGSGFRLNYSTSYVEQLAELIDEIPEFNYEKKLPVPEKLEFLRPKTETLSATEIARIVNDRYGSNVDHKTIYLVGDALEEEGLITIHRTAGTSAITRKYMRSELGHIIQRLQKRDLLCPIAPEGVTSLRGMLSEAIGSGNKYYEEISKDVLLQAEKAFGPLTKYRFQAATSIGISTEQIATVKLFVDQHVARLKALSSDSNLVTEARRTLRRPEEHPDGHMTLYGIGAELGVSARTYNRAFENIQHQLGEVALFTHGPRGYRSFDPKQTELIKEEIARISVAERSDGRLSVNDISERIGVSSSVLRKYLKDPIYEHKIERVGQRPVPTYDPSIIDALLGVSAIKYLADLTEAPNEVMSVSTYAKDRRISIKTARKVIDMYHMPIGDFGFGMRKKPAAGLMPRDQSFIDEHLNKR